MEQQQRKGRAMERKPTDHELLRRCKRKTMERKTTDDELLNSSKRKPSSFFKIMVGDFKNVLFIPPQFARTIRSLVNQTVFLRDSNGQTWRVKLFAINDQLAFQEGWHDFVVDHFITLGEFVVFNYTDRAVFKVDVFGTSCCKRTNFDEERKESSTGPKRNAVEVRHENIPSSKKQTTSNEIKPVESVPDFPHTEEIIDLTEEGRKCRSVSKKISKKPDDNGITPFRISSLDNAPLALTDGCAPQDKNIQKLQKFSHDMKIYSHRRGRPPKERKEEFKSLLKGKAIQVKVGSMDENKAVQAIPVRLPSQFGKTRHSRKVIVLCDPCRRLWPVLYHVDLTFTGFIGGWEHFFRANKLKEGDLCEFEVASGSDNMLDVQIIRV